MEHESLRGAQATKQSRRICLFFILLAPALLGLPWLAGTSSADGPIRRYLRARAAQQEPAPAAKDISTTQIDGLDVAYWLPPTGAEPAPLVIFSHGLNGCKTQSGFLMRALAAHGYVVVAPDHQDALCGGAARNGGGGATGAHRAEQPLRDYAAWNDQTHKGRADDIKRLYAALQRDATWSSRIDWRHVGLAGHSLGGYTVVGLAGGWPSWKMDGVGAVLALSPYVGPFLAHGDLAHLGVPVMYQGGTRDFGVTPSIKRANGAFDRTAPPVWFVELDKTGHFGWTDLQVAAHDSIIRYSVWFFDHAFKGDNTPIGQADGVAELRVK